LAPPPVPSFHVEASAADIDEGGALYRTFCARCHGVSGGALPDLRYCTGATHAMFERIVRGGARRVLGMPAFANDVSVDQVRMIQAYGVDEATSSARAK